MCPLRFVLVFLSAVLAGYFAWSTVRSSQENALVSEDSCPQTTSSSSKDKQELHFKTVNPFLFHLILGFWDSSLFTS